MNRIVLLFFLFLTDFLFAQYSISGAIKDKSNDPIAYANILLLKSQDSTIVTGTSSDDFGMFTIENINSGSYILKPSFIGFKDVYIKIKIDNNIEMETIFLEELVETLEAVEFVIEKPTLKREVDRLVFDVQNTSLSEGNMMEVLRSTPSVIVIGDDLLVKNSSPTVYINDRKIHLSSSDLIQLLEGTPAGSIKSVEVITNPSARYDAESGVVLNIVMTKNLITGYNGSVFSNYTQGVYPRTNHGMSHYFKNSKVDVFLNYSYGNEKIDRVGREFIDYSGEEWRTSLDRTKRSESHNIGLNLDYDLGNNSSLAFAGNVQFLPYFKHVSNGITLITPSSEIGRINSSNLSREDKHNIGLDLDYSKKFDNDSRLSFNSHYTNYDYNRNQDVNSNYFDANFDFFEKTRFNTKANQGTNIFTAQSDLLIPIDESTSLEAGAKYSNINTESQIIHIDIVDNSEILNLGNTNSFDYQENVYAGYVNFDSKINDLSIVAGLRAEQTEISGVSSNGQNNKQSYLEWFPTISVGFPLSDYVEGYINYKRSLTRPDYSYLNPFVYYFNDNTIVTGNPSLKPEFTNTFLIGTTVKNKYTFELHYNRNNNGIVELPFQNNTTNIITYTPVNIDRSTEVGFDFEIYLDITDGWNFYLGSSTSYYKDEGTIEDTTIERDIWYNYSILSNDFTFLKDKSLTAGLNITYVGKNLQGLQVIKSRVTSDFSIQKTILKEKGVLSLMIADLFNDQDFFIKTQFADQNSRVFYNLDNRYIKLGFRYKFGNTKLSTNERETSKEERDRLGDE